MEISKELYKYAHKNIKTLNFIKKAIIKHGNKYDYTLTEYKHSQEKININCILHGNFLQKASDHLRTSGCKQCGMLQKSTVVISQTKIKFYEYVKNKHNNKYKYFNDYIHSEKLIKIECPEHGIFYQLANNHRLGSGCSKCGINSQKNKVIRNSNEFFEFVKNLNNNKYKYFNDYNNSQENIKIECPKHGIFYQLANNHYQGKGCSQCSTVIKISKAELEIVDWLKELSINNIQTSNRNILNNKELDIYLPDHKLAIEFNGIYWHSEDYKDDNYHLQKTEECLSKGITLIHIFEDEWLMKKNIVKSRIKNLLKLTKSNKTIYARNTFIKEIDSVQARKFLDNNHLQGFVGAKIHLGLFYKHNNNEYLVSYMSFGNLRKNLGQREINDSHYELLRFCNFIDYRVIGGASKLLKYFEKTYKPERIISYADRRWSTGNLYEQLKFTLSHKSKPNYFYLEGNKRHNRFGYRKDILISKYNCNPEMTEKEFCRDILGLTRIYDCGNLVYEKNNFIYNIN